MISSIIFAQKMPRLVANMRPIALQVGRAKDKARLLQFIEAGVLDPERFPAILARHQLIDAWQKFRRQFLTDTPMTFDLPQILASKRAFRHTLAARDITEKLRMLDALRERALTLRPPETATPDTSVLREDCIPYRAGRKSYLP